MPAPCEALLQFDACSFKFSGQGCSVLSLILAESIFCAELYVHYCMRQVRFDTYRERNLFTIYHPCALQVVLARLDTVTHPPLTSLWVAVVRPLRVDTENSLLETPHAKA